MSRIKDSPSEPRPRLRAWWSQGGLGPLLVAAAAFLAYWPCLQGGFVWDDDAWTTKLAGQFQDLSGLGALWSWPTPLQQYYPLSATTFWLDYQLWGFWVTIQVSRASRRG